MLAPPSIAKVKKRNGEMVSFETAKILSAVAKAYAATRHEANPLLAEKISAIVIGRAEQNFSGQIPSVENIQDLVEEALMQAGLFDVAKAYVLYREKRKEEREKRREKLVQQFDTQTLKVTKADGSKEVFDLGKIKAVLGRATQGYEEQCRFDDFILAFKKNIVDGMKTSDIAKLLIKTCVDLVTVENILWQYAAARILLGNLYKQAIKNRNIRMDDIYAPGSYLALFDDYVKRGLYYKNFYDYYTKNDILEAGRLLAKGRDESYDYTTLLSLEKRYLLNPNKIIMELPQEMYLSIALFLAIPEKQEDRLAFAGKIYQQCSKQKISLPTPTLLNARTNYPQLSSCFKINADDDLRGIYHALENMAQISKFGGGVGVYLGNIRARGSSIRGISGASGGVTPWVKIINDTAIAVNQLGARLGSISVTLDIWHADIYGFFDLQTETGDIRSKSFDIFPAVSIPDLFMKRLKEDGDWTLLDPHEIKVLYGKNLQDHFGEAFVTFYETLEKDERLTMKKTVKAKELFKKFLKTVVETGLPYVFFRDTVNRLNPNKHAGNIYSSQLCAEICQNTSPAQFINETIEEGEIVLRYKPGDLVVCSLASVNVAKVNAKEDIAEVFPLVTRLLDNVITLNHYPIKEAENTARRYRSIGLGYLGLAEYLAVNHKAYDSKEARSMVNELFAEYAYHTYRASVDLAKERGAFRLFEGSEYQKGILLGRPQKWFIEHTARGKEWETLFADMKQYGVRFAYHTAPAPNTSTAGVVGTTAALLPIYKRYFVETNLSAPTIRVAPKLDKGNFWFYKEYIHMDMNEVIDMIAVIYQWVDQSISFEWIIDPTKVSPAQLYNYYLNAWEQGIKTVYYVRSLSGEVNGNCASCSG
ncbi:MAG: Ribonucleoside-diphosphate reductase [Parcubacteria group bacterium GW2011_GWC2_42_12]|nr:MAG: Ribonucleoside-diphosphate reductase [Parcubacteria group bacterium GW2011_GWC2_42_12]